MKPLLPTFISSKINALMVGVALLGGVVAPSQALARELPGDDEATSVIARELPGDAPAANELLARELPGEQSTDVA